MYNSFEVASYDPIDSEQNEPTLVEATRQSYSESTELVAHVATGCMHNSADRSDAPKCHEETRKAVQEDIFGWSGSCGEPGEVLWLTGPAGAGKSAIMGTISDKFKKAGQLAATFFFSSYAGTAERMSKRGFVTTLAYQLQRHPYFKDRLSRRMMAAIRDDPTIVKMSLQEQMEVLILQPLRVSEGLDRSALHTPIVIIVDGVDECGEDHYDVPSRSRKHDQVEVLSVLLQAAQDPAFPFRIIIASRPETWIRGFFTTVGPRGVTEIFLDEKYDPDDDIRLFLKSKFADLCRRYGLDPSTWPSEEAITKLVQDASGQFIYVATVLRFIDAPPQSPQTQLEVVLNIKRSTSSNPFSALDDLYTSILQSSPSPSVTIVWLKALQVIKGFELADKTDAWGRTQKPLAFSAWTTDRLFEDSAGQAKILLGLPSLVYIREASYDLPCDSFCYGSELKLPPSLVAGTSWNAAYAFYHKSFLDYLGDDLRCGIAFPDASKDRVESWIWERCTRTLMCKCSRQFHPVNPTIERRHPSRWWP